ncbi:MAG TPA: bifunctional ADP-dependent NAD(P)H-hydrate dehydratase/NAD(P)H-hydrate epimerase [Lachnospiraceae bacterium]|nr:bifunctional ADP-dependent NAD(P)H-hydrate dehydratase/NAD(P)H-hydrate epimerase [Lachnospiraceae bacterium]
MKRILNSRQMQETDRYTIDVMQMPAMVLMEKAAEAVYRHLMDGAFDTRRVLVLCGSGNNGGDGMAVARMLTIRKVDVELCLAGNPEHFTTESARQWKIAENYSVKVVKNPAWCEYTTIIDALFGTGLSRPVSGKYAEWIEAVNTSPARVLSVDIPSGVNGSTGQIMGHAVRADETVTFAFHKPGCLLYPGASCAGRVHLADVGIYETAEAYEPDMRLLEHSDLRRLPPRMADGNKGTFGKILIIAGSKDIYGALYMCASAAFRAGAGMVKVLTVRENREILAAALPEAMVSCYDGGDWLSQLDGGIRWADYIGIGPGLGTGERAAALVQALLEKTDKPIVIDADGLNILSSHRDWLTSGRAPVILTPHLGEMSRFTGIPLRQLKEDPLGHSAVLAKETGAVVVMKDAHTVIGLPDGGTRLNILGNSGMATAGSGDVLTGTILGCLGSGLTPADAASVGVLLHACAGDLAAEELGEASLMAMDICSRLGRVIMSVRETCGFRNKTGREATGHAVKTAGRKNDGTQQSIRKD